MMHYHTHILYIILVYHSPPLVTPRLQLPQFSIYLFHNVLYLSINSWILYVFQLSQVAFSLLLSLFCICTPHRILDYYLLHLVVHNHNHMSRYNFTNLVIHQSSNHIIRYQSMVLMIYRSPNHITTYQRTTLICISIIFSLYHIHVLIYDLWLQSHLLEYTIVLTFLLVYSSLLFFPYTYEVQNT